MYQQLFPKLIDQKPDGGQIHNERLGNYRAQMLFDTDAGLYYGPFARAFRCELDVRLRFKLVNTGPNIMTPNAFFRQLLIYFTLVGQLSHSLNSGTKVSLDCIKVSLRRLQEMKVSGYGSSSYMLMYGVVDYVEFIHGEILKKGTWVCPPRCV